MSISTVITEGFGVGSAPFVITEGYGGFGTGTATGTPAAAPHDNNPVPQTTGGWRKGGRILRDDWEEIDRIRARLERLERDAEAAEAKAFEARTARAVQAAAREMAAVAEAKHRLEVEIRRRIEAAEQDEEEALMALLWSL